MGSLLNRSERVQIPFEQVYKEVKEKLASYPPSVPENLRKRNSGDFEQYIKSESYLRIIGCLFGCLIGDALGAYCEFKTTALTEDLLAQTMDMPGGGVFGLYRGQFTDDSEMAFHLLRALTSIVPGQRLDKKQCDRILLRIAKEYVEWGSSEPFDIGITCRKGIQVLATANLQKGAEEAEGEVRTVLEKVKEVNGSSQSNGSLMRIAPMAIFFALIDEDPQTHVKFIKSEIALIHCNEVLQEAGFIWVKVLYDLIKRRNSQKETYQLIFKNAEKIAQNQQVKNWFDQAKLNPLPANENMGWAKIAWTYGMGVLYRLSIGYKHEFSYEKEIKDVIGRGGDSDTNAAIVGGLLGAIVGFKGLPGNYLLTLFRLEFPEVRVESRDRPKHYEPINVLTELFKLIRAGEGYKRARKQEGLLSASKM